MDDVVSSFFAAGPFIPHGHCYLWKSGLVGLHVSADALIALAYYSIPLTLFYFVRKRQDLPFHGIFLLFAAFIIACGTTHIAEIWTLWYPTYWVSGTIKAATALVSVFTAIELVPLVPLALALPSPAQLKQANLELQAQIEERLRAEESLRHYQSQLEQRVQERTAELSQANEQLEAEIRERKRAEVGIALLNRDLQNRLNELQTLFEVVPVGILITDDLEFKRVKANPAFAQILGLANDDNASYTPPEGSSNPSYKILRNGQELTPDETPLRYAAIHGVTVERTEVEILRFDGALFNLYGYAAPLWDEQGRTRGAVGAFLDITDRKQAEAEREQLLGREQSARQQAETANRLKDEFLSVLSHEIRTPLNGILGWAQLLRRGTLDRSTTARALETIERNAKVQAQLIDDLLDVSRIIQGKLRLEMRPCLLVAVLESAIETIRPAAEAKAIELQAVLHEPASPVFGDANRLQQVVWNLLANAVKFTSRGGRVEVYLERVDDFAQIRVQDTGVGIQSDFLPYVFERFRQADSTTTRRQGGLGLGLAIVRHLVELHGGTVAVDSPGQGQGASFRVQLPLMARGTQAGQSEPPAPGDNPPISLEGLRVLVVDDDADSRQLVAFVLEQHGAAVTTATAAADVLAALRNAPAHQRPELLLSDINMPDTDGYTLLRQIRALSPEQGGQTPAIALTAYARAEDRTQALLAGFQVYLPKPVSPEELVKVVAQLAGRLASTCPQDQDRLIQPGEESTFHS